MFLSIIMPTYKTPIKYVERMINSIIEQTVKDFELIVIDDGSGEEYFCQLQQICDIEKDINIQLIKGEHQGVSSTRNIGIEKARGKYIAFVDADDTVSPCFVEEAREYTENYRADIVFGCLQMDGNECVQSGGKIEVFQNNDICEVVKSLVNIRPRKINYRILGSPCARVYRSDIVKNVCFTPGLGYCEDFIFNRKILNCVNKVIVVPDVWYHYYINDFSAMNKKVKENYFEMVEPYWDELYLLNNKDNPELNDGLYEMSLRLYYSSIIEGVLYKRTTREEKIEEMKSIANHKLFQQAIDGLKITSRYLSPSRKLELILLKSNNFGLLYKLIEVNRRNKLK